MKKVDVITYFGTQEKVAQALGIRQGCVSRWGETIPHLRAYQIEDLTKGALKVNGSYRAELKQTA